MNKKIVFIIKPDFINKKGFDIISSELQSNNIINHIEGIYKITDFEAFTDMQRELEEHYSDRTLEVRKSRLEKINYTTKAYKEKYTNYGIAIVLDQKELEEDEFYSRAYNMKETIRNNFIRSRDDIHYVIHTNSTYEVVQGSMSDYESAKNSHLDVQFAHFNGIHLEDYEEFKDQTDYRICQLLGVTDKKNEIKIKALNQESNPAL
ncbi:MAG: hypothetical protein IJA61_04405 [Clostridia bacterium]|nr:hypothetical protein [Clostridia bacterium]